MALSSAAKSIKARSTNLGRYKAPSRPSAPSRSGGGSGGGSSAPRNPIIEKALREGSKSGGKIGDISGGVKADVSVKPQPTSRAEAFSLAARARFNITETPTGELRAEGGGGRQIAIAPSGEHIIAPTKSATLRPELARVYKPRAVEQPSPPAETRYVKLAEYPYGEAQSKSISQVNWEQYEKKKFERMVYYPYGEEFQKKPSEPKITPRGLAGLDVRVSEKKILTAFGGGFRLKDVGTSLGKQYDITQEKITTYYPKWTQPYFKTQVALAKGLVTEPFKKPVTVGGAYALSALGTPIISGAKYGAVRLAGAVPATKAAAPFLKGMGIGAQVALGGGYAVSSGARIAAQPDYYKRVEATGGLISTEVIPFAAGAKLGKRLAYPIEYRTSFEKGFQALPKARQAKIRAEFKAYKAQYKIYKGKGLLKEPRKFPFEKIEVLSGEAAFKGKPIGKGMELHHLKSGKTVKITRAEHIKAHRLMGDLPPKTAGARASRKWFIENVNKIKAIGGSGAMQAQLKSTKGLREIGDIDVYTSFANRGTLAKSYAKALRQAGLPARTFGSKVKTIGRGGKYTAKVAEFQPYKPTFKGISGMGNIRTIASPLKPYSSSITYTKEGLPIISQKVLLGRKLYGGFEVGVSKAGVASISRYTKDIPDFRKYIAAQKRGALTLGQDIRTTGAKTKDFFKPIISSKKSQLFLPTRISKPSTITKTTTTPKGLNIRGYSPTYREIGGKSLRGRGVFSYKLLPAAKSITPVFPYKPVSVKPKAPAAPYKIPPVTPSRAVPYKPIKTAPKPPAPYKPIPTKPTTPIPYKPIPTKPPKTPPYRPVPTKPRPPAPYTPLPSKPTPYPYKPSNIRPPPPTKIAPPKLPKTKPSKKFKLDTSRLVPFAPKYFASVEATFFGIKGTKPTERALATGLAFRPIVKGG